MLNTWKNNASGTTAITFAVTLPLLLLLSGLAIDMSSIQTQSSRIQAIADDGALFAAREMEVSGNDQPKIEQAALAHIKSLEAYHDIAANISIDYSGGTVSVDVSATPNTFFGNPLGLLSKLSAQSVASLPGETTKTCLITLDPNAPRALALNQTSELTAPDCTLYSNSTSDQSLRIFTAATLTIGNIILVGDFSGSIKSLPNGPITNALPIADPFAGQAAPTFGSCDYVDHAATEDDTLDPGVYCGGLEISGADITLNPGEYIIKDGPLSVNGDGSIIGTDVGFYLTGKNAKLNFDAASHISLSAPRSGALTGLLFFADSTNPKAGSVGTGLLNDGHVIRSNDARTLTGTIYLPDDKLIIDGTAIVADQSDFTVIIAQSLELNDSPHLVINSNFTASNVPVPAALSSTGATSVALVR